MEIKASPNKPKLSLPTLEIQNNYYVVPSGGMYHYFPVRIEEPVEGHQFLLFKKAPPILVDGFVFFKKNLYEVSSDDIMRLRVRKSKIVQRESLNGTSNLNRTSSSTTTRSASGRFTKRDVQGRDESATIGAAIVEVDLDANAAWEDQAESLLHLISSQEGGEWEIESAAQP